MTGRRTTHPRRYRRPERPLITDRAMPGPKMSPPQHQCLRYLLKIMQNTNFTEMLTTPKHHGNGQTGRSLHKDRPHGQVCGTAGPPFLNIICSTTRGKMAMVVFITQCIVCKQKKILPTEAFVDRGTTVYEDPATRDDRVTRAGPHTPGIPYAPCPGLPSVRKLRELTAAHRGGHSELGSRRAQSSRVCSPLYFQLHFPLASYIFGFIFKCFPFL